MIAVSYDDDDDGGDVDDDDEKGDVECGMLMLCSC